MSNNNELKKEISMELPNHIENISEKLIIFFNDFNDIAKDPKRHLELGLMLNNKQLYKDFEKKLTTLINKEFDQWIGKENLDETAKSISIEDVEQIIKKMLFYTKNGRDVVFDHDIAFYLDVDILHNHEKAMADRVGLEVVLDEVMSKSFLPLISHPEVLSRIIFNDNKNDRSATLLKDYLEIRLITNIADWENKKLKKSFEILEKGFSLTLKNYKGRKKEKIKNDNCDELVETILWLNYQRFLVNKGSNVKEWEISFSYNLDVDGYINKNNIDITTMHPCLFQKAIEGLNYNEFNEYVLNAFIAKHFHNNIDYSSKEFKDKIENEPYILNNFKYLLVKNIRDNSNFNFLTISNPDVLNEKGLFNLMSFLKKQDFWNEIKYEIDQMFHQKDFYSLNSSLNFISEILLIDEMNIERKKIINKKTKEWILDILDDKDLIYNLESLFDNNRQIGIKTKTHLKIKDLFKNEKDCDLFFKELRDFVVDKIKEKINDRDLGLEDLNEITKIPNLNKKLIEEVGEETLNNYKKSRSLFKNKSELDLDKEIEENLKKEADKKTKTLLMKLD